MNRIAKVEMIKISQEEYLGQIVGGFIVRDDEWILSNTVEKFKRYIESKGFEVAECKETKTSIALAVTKDGYMFAYNGYCIHKVLP
ncbi:MULTISPECIES: hypothetical protein [Erysipelotrichales]|uniref:Uncharacterized protein n=1 Tax=Amedibacterium intestinale TaxID=2583452 RepID=A0A6N4TIY5_9FIRM|nr:hypothetical protein [Amedibacterium intestinale]RHO24546.1 hypothetical protein DW220_00065 [Eubacterium sp. AM18-26]RHO28878.1 hypothetical protein DW212_00685 [Eubacterium sp. AM18-10LB-B]BBK22677.1 hypothetical protein Aargi30884_15800 [Amedibacterium intestinale]